MILLLKICLDVITSFINEFVINVFNNLNNYPELVNIIKNSTVESLPIIVKDIFNNINDYPELKNIFNEYVKQWTETIFNNISSYPALSQFITNAINSHVETTINNIFNNIDNYPNIKNLIINNTINKVVDIFKNIGQYPELQEAIQNNVNERVDYIFNNINNYPELIGILSDLVCNCVQNIFANINNYPSLVTCINNAVNSRTEYIFNNIDRFPILKNLIETKVESRVTYIFENINSFTELLNVIKGNIEDIFDNIDDHTNLKLVIENKVESTVEKILTNIDDYPIIKEKIIQFCNEAIEAKRGVANGIASLDGNGKVPASQLPSYVDDVLEGYFIDDTHFAEKYVEDAPVYYTPEKGKIYVDISTDTDYSGKTYRWSGTKYSVISETLALGEVTGTAYDGGKGKKTTDIVNSLSNELVSRLDRVEQTAEGLKIIYSKSIKNNDTNLYNTPSPVGLVLNNASKTANGSMSAADKVKLDETLPQQIAKEIQDRKDAIEALKEASEASLAQEIQDRKAADQALDTKLTQAIREEADARTESDNSLMNSINAEAEARANADTTLENKLQTNINNLEKKHDDFVATKGKANGFASLDGNGLVPSSQLPSYVDDVIEVYATYDVSETGKLSNIKLYSDPDHANPITGESGKIYLNITPDEPPYQFRWSGTQFVDSNTSSLILGEVTGTAYDGAKGRKATAITNSIPNTILDTLEFGQAYTDYVQLKYHYYRKQFVTDQDDHYTAQPHKQVDIPASTAEKAGVQTAADKKLFNSIPGTIIISGKGVVQNTDKVWVQINKSTKADGVYGEATTQTLEILAANANRAGVITVEMFNKLNSGLNGDITNALNEAKAYTDAAKTALEKLIQDSDKVIKESLDAHIGNKSNPHNVTKVQIGLGNVQNLAPADMPVSTAQAAAIADAKAAGTKAQTDLSTHANRRDNPHNVTRAQLGLATTDQVVFAKTTAASGFWKESDGRLKSQVENLNHTLDQICNIPTVHFKMNGKYQVGTIAQSLEEIEPLLVSENTIPASQVPNQSRFETFVGEDGQEYVKVKVVEYEMLSVMALEGVKLLRKEFEDFKKQLNNK